MFGYRMLHCWQYATLGRLSSQAWFVDSRLLVRHVLGEVQVDRVPTSLLGSPGQRSVEVLGPMELQRNEAELGGERTGGARKGAVSSLAAASVVD